MNTESIPTPTMSESERPLLTKPQLAQLLQKSPRCIELWMRRGYIPYIKIARSVYFRWADVSNRLDQFTVR